MRMFWTYVYEPVTFGGMSTRCGPGRRPTSLYWLTGFVFGAPGERPGPGAGTNAGVGRTSCDASPCLEPDPGEAITWACDCVGGVVGWRLYCGPIATLST